VTENLSSYIRSRFVPVIPDRPNTPGRMGSGVGDSPALCSSNLAPLLCPRLTPPPLCRGAGRMDSAPLCYAAINGHSEIAKALLEKGAATDAKDEVR
jgi:hypothetical protein